MRITYLVEKVGPYHAFRLGGIKSHDLTVIETRPQSQKYAWKENISIQTFGLKTPAQKSDLEVLILNSRPEVLFITGYGFKEMLWAISIGIKHKIPMSLLSDTTYWDEPKSKAKELIKSWLVSHFQSALVAGTRSREYLISLKMSAENIFQPYDIVDNDYYSEKLINQKPQKPYFLCISRLIPAKNLGFLIKTFAEYKNQTEDPIELVILGNGPLEKEMRDLISLLGMDSYVHLKGFLINAEVREHYQMAEAMILASISEPWGLCINEALAAGIPVIVSQLAGASEDLIQDSISGYVFSPDNGSELIEKMKLIRQQNPEQRASMINQGKIRLENFDLEHFNLGFHAAAEKSRSAFKPKLFRGLRAHGVYQLSKITNS